MKRIESLDGLRGIGACFIAFMSHYVHFLPEGGARPFEPYLTIFYDYGYLAVELFFMLSGFGIAYGYKEKIANGLCLNEFMKNRVLRFYMPFILTTFFAGMVEAIYYMSFHEFYLYGIDIYHFILNIFCMQTGWFESSVSYNVPAWCISVEVLCYLFFYLMVAFCYQRNKKVSYFYYIFILIGWTAIANEWNMPFLYSRWTARGYLCFFIGCLLSERYCKVSEKMAERTGLMTFAFLMFSLVLTKMTGLSIWGNISLCFSIIICPCLIWSSATVPMLYKIFSNQILKYLGHISLSIYLCHWPIQVLIVYLKRKEIIIADYSSGIFICSYIIVTLITAGIFDIMMGRWQKKLRVCRM